MIFPGSCTACGARHRASPPGEPWPGPVTRAGPRHQVGTGRPWSRSSFDGPLVVGVPSVFERGDPPVRSDQEFCWQPKAASGGLDRFERAALGAVVSESRGLTGDRRAQSAQAQQRARPALHAEPPIQHSFRVGDQRERQLGLVLDQFGGGGVENDDLPDPMGTDLVVAGDDRA
jgi:hypothetical protein